MQNRTHLSPVHGWSPPKAETGCSFSHCPLQKIGQKWVKMVLKMSQNNSWKRRYCKIKTTVSCTHESHHMHTHHCAGKLKSMQAKIHPALFCSLNGKYDDMSWFYIVQYYILSLQTKALLCARPWWSWLPHGISLPLFHIRTLHSLFSPASDSIFASLFKPNDSVM